MTCTADQGISSTADNQSGNSFSTVVNQEDFTGGGGGGFAAASWCPVVAAATGTYTVTVTPLSGADSGGGVLLILEVAGLAGTVDQTGGTNGGSATVTTITPTCTGANSQANDFAVGAFFGRFQSANGAIYSTGPGGGWTSPVVYNTNGPGSTTCISYKILSAIETTSITPSQTLITGTNMAGIVATFKGAAVASSYFLNSDAEM